VAVAFRSGKQPVYLTAREVQPAAAITHPNFGVSLGEKRVLQIVLMVAHKFSPSRIRSIH
jgi:hypothetical protein